VVVHDASPAARALLVLEMIQNAPGISADRLAERLGISDRAVRRHVGILREAGIPVESTRGRYGGYRIGRGLRLPPLMFTPSEALGLVMAALVRLSSLAALASFAAAPVLAAILADATIVKLALVIAVLVFARHHTNIRRLLAGTEPRIGHKA